MTRIREGFNNWKSDMRSEWNRIFDGKTKKKAVLSGISKINVGDWMIIISAFFFILTFKIGVTAFILAFGFCVGGMIVNAIQHSWDKDTERIREGMKKQGGY